MTTEQRIVIEPQDVSGFEFECPRCEGRFFVPVSAFDAVRTTCPNCREAWFKVQGGPDHVLLHDFLDMFKRLIELDNPLGVKIRFQIASEVKK